VDDVVGADAFHLATEDQLPEAGGIAVADVRMRQEIRIRNDSGIRLPPIAAPIHVLAPDSCPKATH